jgi:hypothetical protein
VLLAKIPEIIANLFADMVSNTPLSFFASTARFVGLITPSVLPSWKIGGKLNCVDGLRREDFSTTKTHFPSGSLQQRKRAGGSHA